MNILKKIILSQKFSLKKKKNYKKKKKKKKKKKSFNSIFTF